MATRMVIIYVPMARLSDWYAAKFFIWFNQKILHKQTIKQALYQLSFKLNKTATLCLKEWYFVCSDLTRL